MFRAVDPKVNFPDLETRIIDFWREHEIFRRSVEERPANNTFIFYEGPPTANALPGIHHVLSRVFKDLIPRYKTMRGYRVPRKAGWDTHGLPVELEIEKELGLSSKPEIEAFGIAAFNERCRESVSRYVGEWERLSERIAFWADMEHPYITWHNEYIETCWWIFKQLWEKGLVYQDYRSTPHCPRCETSLSDHEVAQGYEENVPDPSVFIKFRVTDEALIAQGHPEAMPLGDRAAIVAWTTTPWTLPGNVALAIHPEAEYGMYRRDGEFLVVATDLAASVFGEEAETIVKLRGSSLVGLRYEPLYRPEDHGSRVLRFDAEGRLRPIPDGESTEGLRTVIAADYVSLEDGTGVVHTAPAFGGEDFDEGKRHGLLFAQPLDLQGIMADGLPGEGKFAKDADNDVLDDLEDRGLLLRRESIKHTYPFCWRCRSPLLYYAKPSWYIRTTAAREQLVEGNRRINWHPEHIKEGRFGNWLENNVDWAVSRERYWGTPLPIWRCTECGEDQCIGSLAALIDQAADRTQAEALEDLHRPFIDEVQVRCDNCGGSAVRVPEVADAWFDSGAMPYAQWHYPFENQDAFARSFPADFVCEGIDQTRGWFYTLHAEATMLNSVEAVLSSISYKNVICHGHIQDEKGQKMSKSRGNVVEPWSVVEKFGADAVRWYMYSAGFGRTSGRFGANLVEEGLRRFQLTLWNTYSFFVSYANIDDVDPRTPPFSAPPEIDRWLLSELNSLVLKVTEELENYDPTDASRAIDGFVNDLSNWYIRRNRRRFWRGAGESDDDKQSAYHTLYTALTTLAKLLAPFTPFLAEEIWQNLVRSIDENAAESVHLAEWPNTDEAAIDLALNDETELVKRICSLGRGARAKAQIKVRQPLVEVLASVRGSGEAESAVLRRNEALILEELNAHQLAVLESEADVVTFEVKPNLPVLGPRLGRGLGAVRSALGDLSDGDVAELRRGRTISVAGHELSGDDVLIEERPREGFASASEAGYTVAVSTLITPELADEGLAREIVRRIQDLRREAGFDLADRITTWVEGSADIVRVLDVHREYIAAETLSTELVTVEAPPGLSSARYNIDGSDVKISVRRNSNA
ncbi:MAG TPA: isoleucine--tRNA ligase [Dehalococcoidia bacterium]|nr:isoleucine--tRNA ligase [Dehalococcoidia bacterium]